MRTRQMLVTQAVQPKPGNPNLDPQNLFFDSESRAVQASATAEEEQATAQSLVMNAQLMRTINRLQTTDSGSQQRTGTAAPARASARSNRGSSGVTAARRNAERCAAYDPTRR